MLLRMNGHEYGSSQQPAGDNGPQPKQADERSEQILGALVDVKQALASGEGSLEHAIDRIAFLVQAAELVELELDTVAKSAREGGLSWAAIGRAAGITGPSAYRKWDEEGKRKHAQARAAKRGHVEVPDEPRA
jgi:hypothetical protein